MKNILPGKSQSATGKFKSFFLIGAFILATLSFTSCSNKGKGDTTTHNDTSSAVSKTVDTTATDSGTKQP